MRRLPKFTGLIILTFLLLGLTMVGSSSDLEKVTMMLDWVPNTNHTGIYVALDKGWYKEQGLKVKVVEPGGNTAVEKVVGTGKAAFGISFQEFATPAISMGVPIVSVAAIVQENTSGFVSIAEKGMTRPRDYTGKEYGGWGMPIEKEIIKTLVNGDGGDFSTVDFINIGKGDLLTMLSQGKFDFAWMYYGWQGIEAQLRDIELNWVMLNDYKNLIPNYYTPIIISSRSFLDKNPDIAESFMHATARGYKFAIENPGEAAEILLKHTPEADPQLVNKSQQWLSPRYRDEAPYWGYQEKAVWENFGKWMLEHGLIEKEFAAEQAFTNEFLPQNTQE